MTLRHHRVATKGYPECIAYFHIDTLRLEQLPFSENTIGELMCMEIPFSEYDRVRELRLLSESLCPDMSFSGNNRGTRVRMRHPLALASEPGTKTLKAPLPSTRGASMSSCGTEDTTEKHFVFVRRRHGALNDSPVSTLQRRHCYFPEARNIFTSLPVYVIDQHNRTSR